MSYIQELATRVKAAQFDIAQLSSNDKNRLLHNIADAIMHNSAQIIAANTLDLLKAQENGISETMLDRLKLDEKRITAMSDGVRAVSSLPDPIGEVLGGQVLENGLEIIKKRVPLGVIGIIYESRPNVTVDAAVLCLKSSNAVILRGGKEAIHSNIVLGEIMRTAINAFGLNPDILVIVEDISREVSSEMMRLNGYIDVLIPRGGAGLIKAVIDNSTIPVIETGTGNCHVYVDEYADLDKAVNIAYNAKVSRPSVCNACETVLVHTAVADAFYKQLLPRFKEAKVTMVGCQRTIDILGSEVSPATYVDYATEFLDYKIALRVVDSIDEAIEHIRRYTTHHSEAIITENLANARQFTDCVDAAAVYVNASTRFTDGEVFGLGAEIGISTQKLHARGPMGLRELTSMKYIVLGDGQIR